jgi:hypothetical protein
MLCAQVWPFLNLQIGFSGCTAFVAVPVPYVEFRRVRGAIFTHETRVGEMPAHD